MGYKRVLLKLSGEVLAEDGEFGISSDRLVHYAREIKKVSKQGVELAVVIGGGNIFRGASALDIGMSRTQADTMGMLATVINALALQSALEDNGVITRVQTAIHMNQVAEPFIRRRAIRHLEKGRVVVFAAGTGNPYFTTDSAAVLRAIEIRADVILKGTKVDGIYTEDPNLNPDATRYDTISFDKAISDSIKVMDGTAFTLSQENNLPIVVFDINTCGNLEQIVSGEKIGTLVS